MIIPPSNIILSNQYTSGNEFIYAESRQSYQGYYYELNSKFFVGKTFNSSSPELIKINSTAAVQPLKSNPSSSLYSNIYNEDIPKGDLQSVSIFDGKDGIRYIAKKKNTKNIFFVSEDDYKNNLNNPLYSLVKVQYDIEFGFTLTPQNIKDIPEIESFVAEYNNNDDFN